jgi:Ca2+-binding EF-hand superfamily protein
LQFSLYIYIIIIEELRQSYIGFEHISKEEIETIFKGIDQDGTGRISYSEFVTCTLKKSIQVTEQRLKEAFDLMDVDKSGFIDELDLRHLLASELEADYESTKNKFVSYLFLRIFRLIF